VIGASSEAVRDEETLELLNYGFSEYVRARAVEADEVVAPLPIADRPGAELPVVAGRAITRVIREGQEFERTVDLPEEVEGPIGFREKLGEMTISVAGTRVARVPLVASLKVPAAGPGRRIQNFLTTPWTLLILGAILLAATAITQRRLRTPQPKERPA
jgi:serine-type D-Ala-D-Ala carboxypeptidase (penicillin-binding protein 5/6)